MDNLLLYSALSQKEVPFELLYCLTMKERVPKKIFDINNYSHSEAREKFRFDQEDISRLVNLLQIPRVVTTSSGKTCLAIEALCITLRRLAYPNRLVDMQDIFDRDKPELSEIFNTVIDSIYNKFQYKLVSFDHEWLSQESIENYAAAIHDKGAVLTRCWGFVDGTVRAMCRPEKHQRACYNGHHRVHALKYQSIVTPNGLIANLFGPIPGSRHDAFMLAESNVLAELEKFKTVDGEPFYIYGDPAYPIRPQLMKPFKGAALTPQQEIFNKSMSLARIAVEWEFGKVSSNFAFLDYKKNQKLFLQPLAKYYVVAVLLSNCHTCIYHSETSQYFNVPPPTLEMYLALD